MLGWNPKNFQVSILVVTSQMIHCVVAPVSGDKSFFITFLYAFNEIQGREVLWSDLRILVGVMDPGL